MELRIKENKIFTILQFTDLHFGDLPWDENDNKTKNLLIDMVKENKPDLIIFTGDNIWTDGVKHYKENYLQFIDLVNSLNVPCALTYGNHDGEDKMTRDMLREYSKGLINHVVKKEPYIFKDRENYYFSILGKDGEEIIRIFMIDSGNEDELGICTYAPLFKEQGDYVVKHSKDSKNSLLFLHMPIPEYWLCMDKIETGVLKETNAMISSSTYQHGVYTNILLNGKVNGIFCGHDHDNNFTFKLNGIELGYGNISGYNCYGSLKRGARVFEISEDGTYKTYVKNHSL